MSEPLPLADLDARVEEAVRAIRARSPLKPRVALTLGSGLGGVIDTLEDAVVLPTSELPHWPRSTVAGHAGRLALGAWQGEPIVALSGRSHFYEGYSLDRVTFAVRVMAALGARIQIFTNAVGAMNPDFLPGDLMVATDHINFIGRRGMFAPAELTARRAGRPVGAFYDPQLRQALLRAGLAAGIPLQQGVLMGGQGPNYETSSEVRMASRLGADVACMSTVHEVTLSAHLGCRTASISCITNRATGLSTGPLSHHDVTEVADRVAKRLRTVLEHFLRSLD